MSLGRREERLAPLDGIAAVVFWVAGVIVLQGPADQPETDASPARALEFFEGHSGAILLGTFLFMIGTLFFLWFLGLVRAQLGPAEGGTRRVSSIAFAAGVATAIALLLMPAVHATGAINKDNLSPGAAQVYLGLGFTFFYAAELATAVFLLATGLTSLSTGAFPKWLAWISLVLALWLLIVPIGWTALLYGFPLWLIVVSVLLWTRSRTGSRPDPVHRTP
jgi:hypothetical protein